MGNLIQGSAVMRTASQAGTSPATKNPTKYVRMLEVLEDINGVVTMLDIQQDFEQGKFQVTVQGYLDDDVLDVLDDLDEPLPLPEEEPQQKRTLS